MKTVHFLWIAKEVQFILLESNANICVSGGDRHVQLFMYNQAWYVDENGVSVVYALDRYM